METLIKNFPKEGGIVQLKKSRFWTKLHIKMEIVQQVQHYFLDLDFIKRKKIVQKSKCLIRHWTWTIF
jgi:hypothetical protein